MDIEDFEEVEYIGDGVYAGLANGMVWIWTTNGLEVGNGPIALERDVFIGLVSYRVKHEVSLRYEL